MSSLSPRPPLTQYPHTRIPKTDAYFASLVLLEAVQQTTSLKSPCSCIQSSVALHSWCVGYACTLGCTCAKVGCLPTPSSPLYLLRYFDTIAIIGNGGYEGSQLSGVPLTFRGSPVCHLGIGRVQKIAVENQQANYQSQVIGCKNRLDRLMVLGDHTHRYLRVQSPRTISRSSRCLHVLICDW